MLKSKLVILHPEGKKSVRLGKRRAPATVRARRWQSAAAAAVIGVALTLIVLSLSHLAAGFALVTGAQSWEAWAWASSIDLGFVACEAAQLCVTTKRASDVVARYTRPAIVGTLAVSAAMNSFALTAHTTALWQTVAAATLGFVIPALIYASARTGIAMWMHR